MTRFLRAAFAAFLLAATFSASAGVGIKSVQLEPSEDGILYSRFPAGDNPGEENCPTGWTCTSIGNGAGTILEVSSTEFDFNVIGSNNSRNSYFAYQDAGSSDIEFTARITDTYAGSTADFASLGIGLRESTAQSSWFFHCQSLQTFAKAAQCVYGDAPPYNAIAAADGESRPLYFRVTYRFSTCVIAGYYSADGSDYIKITETTRCLSDAIAYAFGQSNSASETFQATLDNIALGNTITDVDIVAPIIGTASVTTDDVTIPFTAGMSGVGILNHEIWYSTDNNTFTLLATFTTASPYLHSNVANGTYYYKIRARDNAGTVSDFSSVTSATVSVAGTAPNPPTLNAPTVVSSSQINLSWAADLSGGKPTPTSYQLDWSPNGTSGWTNLLTGTATSYNHTGLTASTHYYYRILAFNGVTPSATYSTDDATTSAASTRNVKFTGTIASDFIRGPNSITQTDAFLVETLPVNQTGDDSFSNAGTVTTCCGPSVALDSHVAASDVVDYAGDGIAAETVTPRLGPYFYRVELFHNKTYNCLNSPACNPGDATNKPRSKFTWSRTSLNFDSMEEFWVGFSLYIPNSFEHERDKGQHGNGPTILNINNNQSEGILEIKAMIKGPKSYPTANSGSDLCSDNSTCLETNNSKIWATWPTQTTIGEPAYSAKDWAILADINACKGKWVDFVIRGVNDPYSSGHTGNGTTEAAITYTANKGLLEIWASDCTDTPDASGYRVMTKEVSVCKAPFGLVQRTGTNQKWGGGLTFYAYGWKPGEPTSRTHSIYYGADEVRYGITGDEGTGYADVNPSGKTWETGEAPCSYP